MKKTVAIFAFIALAISPATGQVAPPVGPMGISAAGIPLLNGNNTYSGTNIFNNPLSALNSGTSAQPSLAIGANNYGFYQSTNQLDSTIAGTQSVIIGNVAGWGIYFGSFWSIPRAQRRDWFCRCFSNKRDCSFLLEWNPVLPIRNKYKQYWYVKRGYVGCLLDNLLRRLNAYRWRFLFRNTNSVFCISRRHRYALLKRYFLEFNYGFLVSLQPIRPGSDRHRLRRGARFRRRERRPGQRLARRRADLRRAVPRFRLARRTQRAALIIRKRPLP